MGNRFRLQDCGEYWSETCSRIHLTNLICKKESQNNNVAILLFWGTEVTIFGRELVLTQQLMLVIAG